MMKIYTYYENIGKEKQDELIELWKISWSRQGFEPVVLDRSNAKKCKFYDEYYDFVVDIHKKACNFDIQDLSYSMSAQLEIPAFATIDGPAFFSDYDVINIKYKPFLPNKKVHWRDGRCTCFSTGGKSGWENYIIFLFNHKDEIINYCRKIYQETKRSRFHDQDFLKALYRIDSIKNILDFSKDRRKTCAAYDPILNKHLPFEDINDAQIIHLSNNNCIRMLEKYDEVKINSVNSLRLLMAKQLLGLA